MSTARLLACTTVAAALALGSPHGAQANGRRAATTAGTGTSTRTTRRAPAKPTKPVRPKPGSSSSGGDAELATGRTARATRSSGPARPTRSAAGTAATESAAPRRLTRDQRFVAAEKGVAKSLRRWVGSEVVVRTAFKQIQISPNNRLLGRGPIDIVVTPKVTTGIRGFINAFRPSLNRRMMVAVNEYGNVTPLDDQPNSIQHRAWRTFNTVVPVTEILVDVFTSKQSQGGLVAAAASIPAFLANPFAGGVVATTAAGLILAGRKERTTNRDGAFRRMMTWARAREKGGNRPALSEAYGYYKLQLKNTSTRPVSFRQFVERVALEDFDGQGDVVETQDPPPAP